MEPSNSKQVDEILSNLENIPIEFADSSTEASASVSDTVCDMEYDEQEFVSAELLEKYISGELSLNNYSVMLSEDVPIEESPKTSSQSRQVKEPTRSRGTKLPPHLNGLMGEANIRFARGDHGTAEKMCLEVIRQFARAPEPYLTLAQMYENTNPVKSLEYNMIAAFCNPRNVDLWVRLAQLSMNIGNISQAIVCYSNAIRAQPTNVDLHLKRISLLSKKLTKYWFIYILNLFAAHLRLHRVTSQPIMKAKEFQKY